MEYSLKNHTNCNLESRIYHWVGIFLILIMVLGSTVSAGYGFTSNRREAALAAHPEDLIRFHVLANSDSEEDQALKRAVRDAILKEVSPRLAESQSLEESRSILTSLRPQMEKIGKAVVQAWGKDYEVQTDYGHFSFPTKSYGTLVLPAGEYEAVRVLIGKAEGSNWWCVLFPPLCFVDIEHSTAVQVDGKPGIPLQQEAKFKGLESKSLAIESSSQVKKAQSRPNIKFWIWEKIKKFL